MLIISIAVRFQSPPTHHTGLNNVWMSLGVFPVRLLHLSVSLSLSSIAPCSSVTTSMPSCEAADIFRSGFKLTTHKSLPPLFPTIRTQRLWSYQSFVLTANLSVVSFLARKDRFLIVGTSRSTFPWLLYQLMRVQGILGRWSLCITRTVRLVKR